MEADILETGWKPNVKSKMPLMAIGTEKMLGSLQSLPLN